VAGHSLAANEVGGDLRTENLFSKSSGLAGRNRSMRHKTITMVAIARRPHRKGSFLFGVEIWNNADKARKPEKSENSLEGAHFRNSVEGRGVFWSRGRPGEVPAVGRGIAPAAISVRGIIDERNNNHHHNKEEGRKERALRLKDITSLRYSPPSEVEEGGVAKNTSIKIRRKKCRRRKDRNAIEKGTLRRVVPFAQSYSIINKAMGGGGSASCNVSGGC